ncbi:hypothetical protein R3O64_09535 [Corynebacterium hesseae]|uniref:hypothetical protein n=1 Tax=Corynebacterium hesseae TaxID=2913502 RepID=UPI0030CE90D9
MTSPFTKPGATQDKYQDVYSKGGTYGSDLRSEADVRRLLKTEIRSPFAKAVQDVVNAVEGVVGDIASAIRGEGARYEVINVAVTERLGPINTLITQTGARHKELADKVDRSIEKQAGINQEQAKTIKEAGDAVQALKDYKAEVQAKVQSSIDTAKSATSEAAALRSELTKLSNGLDARIEQSKAAKDLQNKFDRLNNEFGSRVDSAISGSAKVRELSEQSKVTLDALMNPIDVGTSLVTVNPVTKVPYWAEGATENTKLTSPVEGAKIYTHPAISNTYGGMVTVDPRLEYEASFWLHIDTKNVRTVIEFRGQDGGHAVKSVSSFDDSQAKYSSVNYIWWSPPNMEPGWHYIHQRFRLNDNVSQAKLANIYWVHGGGASGNASICDLRISPLIPTQASVDAAQNKAIEALEKATATHTLSLANQKQINEESAKWRVETEDWKAKKDQFQKTTEQFQKTQAKVEELQTKTDDAQNKALELLNKPELNGSLVPMVPNGGRFSWLGKYDWVPEYTTFSHSRQFGDSISLQATGRENTNIRGAAVDAIPGGTYKVEFTAYASVDDSSIFLELRNDADLSHAIKSSTPFLIEGDSSKKEYPSWGGYLLGDVRLKKGLYTYTGYITLKDDVSKVRLYTLYWNHPNGTATGTQRLDSLKVYRHVPSQAEVDELQNKALEQSEKFQIEQERINRLVQTQLWDHQDTMEFLDIRAPKTYGYEVAANIWTVKANPYQSVLPAKVNTGNSPFITVLVTADDKPRTCYIVCKGKWFGSFEVRINWTNGAVDVWNNQIDPWGARVFKYYGGNSVIGIRNISVTVTPESLRREMKVSLGSRSIEDRRSVSGDTSLLRGALGKREFRVSAPVMCDEGVEYLSDEGTWVGAPAFITIPRKVIRITQPSKVHTFSEGWGTYNAWDKPKGNDYDTHNSSTRVISNSVG